ncbi:MAG: ABC transporter permease [Clostridiales bacterium]|nr:ABC transporter permease [Clostridiales bacterium]
MQGQQEPWDTIIRPKRGWFDIDFKELIRYWDLAVLLVKRNFTVLYKQTILGPAWVVIQPLMTTLVFTVVFGGIAGLPTDGMPSFLFYMGGNILWGYFSSCLSETSRTFISNRGLFGKVYFPRLVMPISVSLSKLINFLVQFVIFSLFLVYFALKPGSPVHPNFAMIAFTPLLLIQTAVLGMGFGIIISSLTTKYRDLNMLVGFGVHLWMYATPVAYSSSLLVDKHPELIGLYMINPMTPVIEYFRSAYLGVENISLHYMPLSVAVTLVVMVLGLLLFSRVEKTFMDTV